jgi:hypothetical protein
MQWYKLFKEGQLQLRTMNVQDNLQHKKMKKTSQKVWKVICSNCCLTVHEVAETAGISKTTCDEILTKNLGMHRFAFKLVPCLLSDQKRNRVDVSKDLVNCANADENLKMS